MGSSWRNIPGAFADGAILFPILAALSMSTDLGPARLLVSTGVAYLAAALVFRIPMPIQPLKSVAIAAIALGASGTEVRVAGALVGLVCIALLLANPNEMAGKIPISLIHGVQMALGFLLVLKGMSFLGRSLPPVTNIAVLVLIAGILIGAEMSWFPLLGVMGLSGMVLGLMGGSEVVPEVAHSPHFRWEVLAALVLPQLVLTLSNSVVATHEVAKRYYGKRAERATPYNLLASIGAGNVISAAIGGLPFCHGSGGLTAHYRAGSTHWISNVVIGLTILALAWGYGNAFQLVFPVPLLAALLVSVGIFHARLAAPSWAERHSRLVVVTMGLTAVLTQNMLWVMIAGVAVKALQNVLGLAVRTK
ncbi:MAG: putative sulfate/molybdate transporter [Bdellovibrionales bacterium]|nr:putative sulfate/molybdate transporter [Bdellovibrionales bacterium]